MILVAGIPSEPPLRLVVEAAAALGVSCVIFNQREAHACDLSLQLVNNRFDGFMRVRGREYRLDAFNGVYVRLMDYYYLPEIKNRVFYYVGENLAEKSLHIHQYFLHWLEIADCRVLNRPTDTYSNLSKPYQSQLCAALGFAVPPTCITNQQDVALRFLKRSRRVVFKSISGVRSIVQELQPSKIQSLHKLSYLPTQFQKRLDGTNIRAHIVGDALFATRIKSKAVDYRYAGKEGEKIELSPFELPRPIRTKCLELSNALRLPLCGVDLFLARDGSYYCFEVNPCPAYSYYQENTGQDIATAIVRYLEYGRAGG